MNIRQPDISDGREKENGRHEPRDEETGGRQEKREEETNGAGALTVSEQPPQGDGAARSKGEEMQPIDTSYLYVKREGSMALRTIEPPPVWQSIWFQARARPWRSLAVVPVDDQAALSAAKFLQQVGRLAEGNLVTVVDGTGLTLDAAKDLLSALDGPAAGGGRIIAVDPPTRTPSSIPLARSADAAVLLVGMGRTSLAQARKTMELVGASRFVGCVAAPSPKRRRRRRRRRAGR